MPVLRPDTLVQKALQILAVTGEFPWSSLYLLGNPPTVQKMVEPPVPTRFVSQSSHRGGSEDKALCHQ